MVSGKKTDEHEEGLLDCQTAHHNAVTSHADYTPKCSFDGNYEQIHPNKYLHDPQGNICTTLNEITSPAVSLW